MECNTTGCPSRGDFHLPVRSRRVRDWIRRSADSAGQATVEYVGLAVAVAVLLGALGGGLSGQGSKVGKVVVDRLTDAIQTVAK